MNFLRFNRIAGWVLFALLVIFGSREISHLVMAPKELAEPAYKIAGVEETPAAGAPAASTPAAGAAPAAEAPFAQLLGAASVEKGQAGAKKCVACHSFDKGRANKIGPNLWGIVEQDIAGVGGFKYSDALQAKTGTWTYDALSAFLAEPKTFAPGTRMAFAGIKSAADRADMIVYLRSLADSPKSLPGK